MRKGSRCLTMSNPDQIRVALYARVSTIEQAEKELPIESQLSEMRTYAQQQGWTVTIEFVEKGESATTDNRPEFQRMVNMAREKNQPFDLILVWSFSRFARDRKISVTYKEFLRRHDVRVVSVTEPVDDSVHGELIEGLFELLDEMYSKNLAQNIMRSMRLNAEKGFHNGGTILIGFKLKKYKDGNNTRNKLEPDETYAPIIRRIFQMYMEGNGIKAITSTLNSEGVLTNRGKTFNIGLVNRILRNETYIGTLIWNKTSVKYGKHIRNNPEEVTRVPNNHPAIIDKETFDAVQAILDSHNPKTSTPRAIGSKQLLSGLLYCGICGSSMSSYPAKSGKYEYYTCNTKRKRGTKACSSKYIEKNKFDEYLIERIHAEILTDENIEHLVRITNEEIGNETEVNAERLAIVERQHAEVKKRLDRLIDAIESGQFQSPDLGERIHERKGQYDLIEKQKRDLEKKLAGGNVEFINRAS